MLKIFPSDKINITKIALFFLPQLIIVLLLIRDSYMGWSTRFISLKVCVWGISHFQFRLVFIKVCILVQQKAWTLILKRHNSLRNIVLLPELCFLRRTRSLKIQRYLRELDPLTNFLSLENQSFEYAFFFSIVTFKSKYLTFFYLLN